MSSDRLLQMSAGAVFHAPPIGGSTHGMEAPSGRFEAKLAEGSPSATEMLEGGAWADPPTPAETVGAGALGTAPLAPEPLAEVGCCSWAIAPKAARRTVAL